MARYLKDCLKALEGADMSFGFSSYSDSSKDSEYENLYSTD
jgi:hypothetical protein